MVGYEVISIFLHLLTKQKSEFLFCNQSGRVQAFPRIGEPPRLQARPRPAGPPALPAAVRVLQTMDEQTAGW